MFNITPVRIRISEPNRWRKYQFPLEYQSVVNLRGLKNHGGTKGGILTCVLVYFLCFQVITLCFESGLRTIGTSIDVNGRLFLCLKSSIRKAFLDFPFNRSQSESTHINKLVSILMSIFSDSILLVYSRDTNRRRSIMT